MRFSLHFSAGPVPVATSRPPSLSRSGREVSRSSGLLWVVLRNASGALLPTPLFFAPFVTLAFPLGSEQWLLTHFGIAAAWTVLAVVRDKALPAHR